MTGFDPRERIAFFYPPVRRLNPLVTQQTETILAQELRLSAPQRYSRPSDMQADLASLLATRLFEPERRPLAASSSDPMKLDMAEIRRRSQQRNLTQVLVFVGICLLIFLIAGFAYLLPMVKATPTSSVLPTPNATVTMISQISALNSEWQAKRRFISRKALASAMGATCSIRLRAVQPPR